MLPIESRARNFYPLATQIVAGGLSEVQAIIDFLRKAYIYKYPKADHTVDGIILREVPMTPPSYKPATEILLVRRGNPNEPFYNTWALPGGFLDINTEETLEEAFRREMIEELNLTLTNLLDDIQEVGTFSDPDRDPRGRVISTVYRVQLDTRTEPKAGDDAAEFRWFLLTELPPLAFDHETIIRKGTR
jgi:8-oxo-dGTP diphosphatase